MLPGDSFPKCTSLGKKCHTRLLLKYLSKEGYDYCKLTPKQLTEIIGLSTCPRQNMYVDLVYLVWCTKNENEFYI